MYVDSVNCFGKCSSDHTSSYLSSDHPIPSPSPVISLYVNFLNSLNTSHLIILSHLLHLSPDCMWNFSILWIFLFWSLHLIRVIRLQHVCEHGQLFENLSSHHTIPFSSSVSRAYVTWRWLIVWIPLIWSSYPISSSVSRLYVDFICLKTSCLIIPSHLLHLSLECTWIWLSAWMHLIGSSHSILFICL